MSEILKKADAYDADQMARELEPSTESYNDGDYDDVNSIYNIVDLDKTGLYKRLLMLESFKERPFVMDDMEDTAERDEFVEIIKSKIDMVDYQIWKNEYLEDAYSKTKNLSFKTCSYIFGGIGQYAETLPDNMVDGFKNWVMSCGSGFFGEVKDATKEEIKNTLGKNCETEFWVENDK